MNYVMIMNRALDHIDQRRFSSGETLHVAEPDFRASIIYNKDGTLTVTIGENQ